MISAVPMTLAEANEFVANFHRHNKPVPGARFAIGASDGASLIGVAIVSRPVARMLQAQGPDVAEVVRCCVLDGAAKGACSFLYAACWRAWRAMGGRRLVTYTLQSESGASLRGAGWTVIAEVEGAKGAAWTSRAGREWQPVTGQAKLRWEVAAAICMLLAHDPILSPPSLPTDRPAIETPPVQVPGPASPAGTAP